MDMGTPYNWKKALANAGLVFIGCFLASIPDADSLTAAFTAHTLQHAVVKCGMVVFFAELRYIYAFLSQWGNVPPESPSITKGV